MSKRLKKPKQKTGFYKLKLVPVDEDEFLVMLSLFFLNCCSSCV